MYGLPSLTFFFFFNDTATTEIYTLSPTRRSSDLGPPGPARHAGAASPAASPSPDPRASGPGDPTEALRPTRAPRSEEHTSELQSRQYLVCRLLLEKKKIKRNTASRTGVNPGTRLR